MNSHTQQQQPDLPQVTLRALEPEDLDVLYRIENDVELWDSGITNVPYSRYTLHDYIAQSTGDIYADRQVRLMIENAVGEVVGIVDIVNFDPRHQRAEVGIVVQRHYRGQGYARAALGRIAAYALKVLHLHQLFAFIDAGNKVSIGLFSQAGFDHTSTLRDWLFDGTQYHDAVVMQKKL